MRNQIKNGSILLDARLTFYRYKAKEVQTTIPLKFDFRASHVRCTCSMQGEKEHKVPSCFNIFPADRMASHGWGRSRNTESANPEYSSGNPSPWISLTPTVTKLPTPVL